MASTKLKDGYFVPYNVQNKMGRTTLVCAICVSIVGVILSIALTNWIDDPSDWNDRWYVYDHTVSRPMDIERQ